MTAVKRNVQALDSDTDLCYDVDARRWYLRQYQHVPPHNTRESVSFDFDYETVEAYNSGQVIWEDWS